MISSSPFTYGAAATRIQKEIVDASTTVHIYNVPGTNVVAEFTVGDNQLFLKSGDEGGNMTREQLIALLEHAKSEHSEIQIVYQSKRHLVLQSNFLETNNNGYQYINFARLLAFLANKSVQIVMHMPRQIPEENDREATLKELKALGYEILEDHEKYKEKSPTLKQAWKAYVTSYTETERAQKHLVETAIRLGEKWFLPHYLQNGYEQSG